MPHFRPPGSYGFRSAASHFRCRRTTVLPGFPAAPLSALPVRGEVGLRPFGMTVPRLPGLETRWAWNPYVVSPRVCRGGGSHDLRGLPALRRPGRRRRAPSPGPRVLGLPVRPRPAGPAAPPPLPLHLRPSPARTPRSRCASASL